MTQPFPFTYERVEVSTACPIGTKFYFPIQRQAIPSYLTPIDFTTVTSVRIVVTRAYDGSVATWTTSTFLAVTVSGLVAVYTTILGDITVTGVYSCRAYITLPGGTIECEPIPLYVVNP